MGMEISESHLATLSTCRPCNQQPMLSGRLWWRASCLAHCLGGETVGRMPQTYVCASEDGMGGEHLPRLGIGPRRERQAEVSRVRSVLRLSRLFGRGPALQSLGCGSICPNSRAKIPVFDANLYVYLHHTGNSLPDGNYDTMTGVGAGEQERQERDKDGCFPLFFLCLHAIQRALKCCGLLASTVDDLSLQGPSLSTHS